MGGGGETSTTQTAEPWSAAVPYLEGILGRAKSLYKNDHFAPDPYSGPRVAGQSGATRGAYDAVMGMGADANLPMGALRGMTRRDPRLAELTSGKDIYRGLAGVKREALGGAIPAAMSMFAGNGMTDSSAAMDTVGRAATEAVAPIEYGAWDAAQNRRLAAVGQDNSTRLSAFSQIPEYLKASYLPAMMMQQVGGQRDAHRQANVDADMATYYEHENRGRDNFLGYADLIKSIGGMGGTSTSTAPGQSGLASAAGAGLGGLGAYGALAMNPATAPFALAGGGLAALMGIL
jgi:hypothetical protein